MRALALGTLLALSLAGAATTASAASFSDARPAPAVEAIEQVAIEAMVTREFDALRREDAEEAFAHVALSAHSYFPTKDAYFALMRDKFAPMFEASEYRLGELKVTSKGLTQEIQFSDRRGRPFLAFFVLENQGYLGWKINNMVLIALEAKEA